MGMDEFDEQLKSHFADKAAGISVESAGAADLVRRGRRRTRRQRAGGVIGVVVAVVAVSIGVRPLITDGDSTLEVAAIEVPTSTTVVGSADFAEESSGLAPSTPQAPIPPGEDGSAAFLPAADSYYGGNQWVLPWGDGFVLITPTWEPGTEETAVAPTRDSAQESSDGLTWSDPVDISLPEGAGSIVRAISDGTHLLVGQQSDTDTNGLTVSITENLTDWVTAIVSGIDEGLPAYVSVDSWMSSLAIGPDGWLATVETSSYVDPWTLLPADVRDWPGGFDFRDTAEGLSVTLYASFVPDEIPTPSDVGEPTPTFVAPLEEYAPQIEEQRLYTWAELGVDPVQYAADRSATEEFSSNVTVWTGAWGTLPFSSPVEGTSGEGISQVIGTDAGFLAIRYDKSNGDPELLFSLDGFVWSTADLPADMPFGGGLSNIVAVDGGVLVGVYDRNVYAVWRGAPDGTGWVRAELPPLVSQNVGLYGEGSSARGFVSVVDTAPYPDFGPPPAEYDVAIEQDGRSIHLFVHTDNTADLVITDLATGEVVAELSGAFNGLAADFARVEGDTVTIFDAEGNDVMVLPTQDVADALAGAKQQVIDESGWVPPPLTSVVPELVVVATTDGLTWTATPLGDVFVAPQYPMAMGINGNTVALRFEEQWRTLEIG